MLRHNTDALTGVLAERRRQKTLPHSANALWNPENSCRRRPQRLFSLHV